MKEYINRNKALSYRASFNNPLPIKNEYSRAIKEYKNWIKNLPKKEIEDIIYCKECKYGEKDLKENIRRCKNFKGLCRIVKDTEFCSKGIKK